MSDLPMKQEDHPAHNMPEPTESYKAQVLRDAMQGRWDYSSEKDRTNEASDIFRDK